MAAPEVANNAPLGAVSNLRPKSVSATPPLIGGGGRTSLQERALPKVRLADSAEGYASLLAQGFDSYQEAINLKVPPAIIEQFEQWQEQAKALDTRAGQAVSVRLGDEDLQVWPCGSKGGVRWVLESDDFMLFWRAPEHDWCLSVRYLSAGIWEHGIRALRDRVRALLMAIGCVINKIDGERVSRADWAFDIYSPEFSEDMKPNLIAQVVCHSSVKVAQIGNAERLETLTLGLNRSGLQIQIYDKTREITEASGKSWMIDLWIRNGWEPRYGEIANVWRLEIRMGGDWLKDRQTNTPEQLHTHLEKLIAEALLTHRLTQPDQCDSNRRRWPLHPLYAVAYRAISAKAMMPLGRYVSGVRSVLFDRLKRQVAGTLRSGLVLNNGTISEADAEKLASETVKLMLTDREGERKAEAARERYKFVEEAK